MRKFKRFDLASEDFYLPGAYHPIFTVDLAPIKPFALDGTVPLKIPLVLFASTRAMW